MTFVVSEATLDDLLHEVLEKLPQAGLMTRPSRGPALEVVGAVLELRNPRARLSRSASRSRVFSALGELVWYLSGSDDLEHIAHYIKKYRKEATEGIIKGAYGPRLFGEDRGGQIAHITQMLHERPFTRQAVVQLFDRQDLEAGIKDPPCTCTLQFLLRDGKLNLVVYMRSNDAFMGLPHDIFAFTMLQEMVARAVGVELGTYQHFVGSLHLYVDDQEDAEAYLAEGWHSPPEEMPAMPTGDPWGFVEYLVTLERELREGTDRGSEPSGSGSDYWDDLGKVLEAFAVLRDPAQLAAIADSMTDDYYRLYLIDRRANLEAS